MPVLFHLFSSVDTLRPIPVSFHLFSPVDTLLSQTVLVHLFSAVDTLRSVPHSVSDFPVSTLVTNAVRYARSQNLDNVGRKP